MKGREIQEKVKSKEKCASASLKHSPPQAPPPPCATLSREETSGGSQDRAIGRRLALLRGLWESPTQAGERGFEAGGQSCFSCTTVSPPWQPIGLAPTPAGETGSGPQVFLTPRLASVPGPLQQRDEPQNVAQRAWLSPQKPRPTPSSSGPHPTQPPGLAPLALLQLCSSLPSPGRPRRHHWAKCILCRSWEWKWCSPMLLLSV